MLAADHTGVLAGLHELALGLVGFLPVDRGDDAILLVFELRIERVVLTQDDGDDGRSYLRANSKSRWSPHGTAMTAPVP